MEMSPFCLIPTSVSVLAWTHANTREDRASFRTPNCHTIVIFGAFSPQNSLLRPE